jgi:two-component system alkaline phosphatase synthesis response regulator PhoP
LKKILIVDDEENFRYLLKMNFVRSGFQCLEAGDGIEALKITREQKPDLIILDLKLPKLPGEEVCKEIKSDKEISNIPIIMLTGKSSVVDRVVGKVVGADCYLHKPCEMNILLENVNKLINR